jgi:phytoene dehydrogenase-like protein
MTHYTTPSWSAVATTGLTAACYPAGAGLPVAVLERAPSLAVRRHRGAHPGVPRLDGPYVLSLMPRWILDDLDPGRPASSISPTRLRRFRRHVPRGGGSPGATPAGEDPKRDAARFADYEAFIERAAMVMDRFILRNPPSWAEVAAEFRSPADLAVFQKCFLGSAADIAEHFFESEKLQAVAAATGIIGTFRGPRDPGTGYVKLYHSMGMATGNRGAWTRPRGDGRRDESLARVARSVARSCTALTSEILIRDGRATGASWRTARRSRAPSCPTPTGADLPARAAGSWTSTARGEAIDREPRDEDRR